MSNELMIRKNTTNVIRVDLGYNASQETLKSEIRLEADENSPLLATWEVSFATDGVDGLLRLVLPERAASRIVPSEGYMDIKRISNGIEYAVFDRPLKVCFIGSVTK